jgi:hypothetical protein
MSKPTGICRGQPPAPRSCRRVRGSRAAYVYLMREGYSTGQVIVVDGGAVLIERRRRRPGHISELVKGNQGDLEF